MSLLTLKIVGDMRNMVFNTVDSLFHNPRIRNNGTYHTTWYAYSAYKFGLGPEASGLRRGRLPQISFSKL